MWLESAPKSPALTLPPDHFSTALCHRLRIPHPCIVPGLACDCTRRTILDSHGLHIISGCNKDACRTSLHDAVKRELNTMLKSGGQLSIVEQRNAFHIIDPDDHRRPDITIISENQSVTHTDISVTCPIPLTQTNSLSRLEALTPSRAANSAKQRKNKLYEPTSNACGATFKPLIFELTGRPHEDVEAIVKQHSEIQAMELHTRWDVIYRYWMSRIATTFQYYLTSAILHRSRNIIKNSTNASRAVSRESVEEFQFHCTYNDAVTRHLGSGGTLTWSQMSNKAHDPFRGGPRYKACRFRRH